jgi:hypothetical protein
VPTGVPWTRLAIDAIGFLVGKRNVDCSLFTTAPRIYNDPLFKETLALHMLCSFNNLGGNYSIMHIDKQIKPVCYML